MAARILATAAGIFGSWARRPMSLAGAAVAGCVSGLVDLSLSGSSQSQQERNQSIQVRFPIPACRRHRRVRAVHRRVCQDVSQRIARASPADLSQVRSDTSFRQVLHRMTAEAVALQEQSAPRLGLRGNAVRIFHAMASQTRRLEVPLTASRRVLLRSADVSRRAGLYRFVPGNTAAYGVSRGSSCRSSCSH